MVTWEASRNVRFQGLLHRTLRRARIDVAEGNSAAGLDTSPPPNHRAQAEPQLRARGRGKDPRLLPLSSSPVSLSGRRQQGKKGPGGGTQLKK